MTSLIELRIGEGLQIKHIKRLFSHDLYPQVEIFTKQVYFGYFISTNAPILAKDCARSNNLKAIELVPRTYVAIRSRKIC